MSVYHTERCQTGCGPSELMFTGGALINATGMNGNQWTCGAIETVLYIHISTVVVVAELLAVAKGSLKELNVKTATKM